MSEFWSPSPHRPLPENRFFVKQAASAAHIYGKRYVAAESFTTLRKPHWADTPWRDMKPAMDYEFCEGLNMIFFHTFTCSPEEMGIPGQEYMAGTHINPQITWWAQSDGLMDYINRVQLVVQQGRFNADVLYYYGDHVPNIAGYKGYNRAGALPGYDYDVTNEEVLLQLEVADGRVVVPSGLRYQILVLPDHKVLSLAALEKVAQLLESGATVIGQKPEKLVSLVGGEAARRNFHVLSDSLWGNAETASGERTVGQGTLVWGLDARDYLQKLGIPLDYEVPGAKDPLDYQYIHYTIDDAEVYFVSNQTGETRTITAAFRVSGKQPEIWDPLTGAIDRATAFEQENDRTTVPLELDPYGSYFVVFREPIPPTRQGKSGSNHMVLKQIECIPGPWQVEFDPVWGGPGPVEFSELTDWSHHPDEGIRYYSGVAVYRNVFEFTPAEHQRYWLQLNRVADVGVASVSLNRIDLGITWTLPFRLEITDALMDGQNHLEVTVVNSWQNRLIGDRGKPESQRVTQTNVRIRDDWILRSSGLLGPVEILGDIFH
jgi:hypothetical protein